MSAAQRGPSVSGAGVAAALFALADIVFWAIRLASALPPPSARMLLVALALSIAAIFLVCRFSLPNRLRVVLIAGIVVVLLATAVRSDLFGLRATEDVISNATALPGLSPGEESEAKAADHGTKSLEAPKSGGARVYLSPGDAGDSGWADRINAAWDGRIGGVAAASFAIDGTVTLVESGVGNRLAVRWSIERNGEVARCGTTTILNAGTARTIDHIGDSFRIAVARTIATGRAACF